jgi:hypothetical protein
LKGRVTRFAILFGGTQSWLRTVLQDVCTVILGSLRLRCAY